MRGSRFEDGRGRGWRAAHRVSLWADSLEGLPRERGGVFSRETFSSAFTSYFLLKQQQFCNLSPANSLRGGACPSLADMARTLQSWCAI